MFEIENIADTEVDELLEHVDLGELEVVELRTDSQDMSEKLLDYCTSWSFSDMRNSWTTVRLGSRG